MSHTQEEKGRLEVRKDKNGKWLGYFCKQCGTKAKYSERYDCLYCITCDWWLEGTCNPDCDCYDMFGGRPEKPSELKE